jgi:hypothetical protein
MPELSTLPAVPGDPATVVKSYTIDVSLIAATVMAPELALAPEEEVVAVTVCVPTVFKVNAKVP